VFGAQGKGSQWLSLTVIYNLLNLIVFVSIILNLLRAEQLFLKEFQIFILLTLGPYCPGGPTTNPPPGEVPISNLALDIG